mgnify:CR=1 FL=1
MDSFGTRFNGTDYIRVDIDFSNGDNTVVMTTAVDGELFTATGVITWDEG